jgi:hypothetical protein
MSSSSGKTTPSETLACELQGDDPDVPFDPALVAACTLPADCSAPFGVVAVSIGSALCLPAGKAPNGAPCVWSSGCQSGVCFYEFIGDGQPACGICKAPVRCNCTPHQECVVTGDKTKCVALPDAGEACGAPLFACKDSKCVASGDDGGTCQTVPQGGAGAPCTNSPAGPDCLFSPTPLYCDHTDHCSPYLPAAYGQPCTTSTGDQGNVCVGAGWCDSTGSGNCQPPAPDGEPCQAGEPTCLPPARCLAGACIFPTHATCSL